MVLFLVLNRSTRSRLQKLQTCAGVFFNEITGLKLTTLRIFSDLHFQRTPRRDLFCKIFQKTVQFAKVCQFFLLCYQTITIAYTFFTEHLRWLLLYGRIKQKDKYNQNFFYTHFILQGVLKIKIPTNTMNLNCFHKFFENIFEYNSHELLDVFKI